MTSARRTSFKIGVFTIVVIVALAAVVLALGLRARFERKEHYYTYMDESVAGLDIGAKVQYRGIPIGTVDRVRVTPEGRLVEVRAAVQPEHAWLLAWDRKTDNGLRARVAMSGISGLKILDIDQLDPKGHPPPDLPFPPPDHYVPAASSLLTELADTVSSVATKLVATLEHVDELIDAFSQEGTPHRLTETLSAVNRAASDLRSTLGRIDDERVFPKASATMDNLDAAIASMRRIMDRTSADGGLLSDAEHVTKQADVLGFRAARLTDDVNRTLRDLSDAARAIRGLADALERDPEMLLKGHTRPR